MRSEHDEIETVTETWYLIMVKLLQLPLKKLSINPAYVRRPEYFENSLSSKNETLSLPFSFLRVS